MAVTKMAEMSENLKGFDVLKMYFPRVHVQHEMTFTILTSDKKVGFTL